MPQLLGSGPGASKRLFSVIPGDSPKLLIRAWNLLSRFPNHGVNAERKRRDWQAAWLFLQQATTLLILWFAVSSSGVPQVKSRQHGAVPQGHLANSRPYHQAGTTSETTAFLGKYQLAGACRLVLSVLNKIPQDHKAGS